MKYLIIRFSSIGDIVLTTPVIRCLKKQSNENIIHFLTKDKFVDVLKANPYLDKIYTIQKNPDEILSLLKSEGYDYVIDLHQNLRSNLLKIKLLASSFSFDKLNIEKWLIVNFKINILPKQHIVDRYLNTLSAFNIENDLLGLDYFIPEGEEVDFSLIPVTHRADYIAVAIGGTYFTKRLPAEKIIKICQKIKRPIYLLGGKEDKEVGTLIANEVGSRVYNGCGKFSLNESASIIKHAYAVVTHDTGLMHIASAFKKNIISVWGNTIPEFGMGPYLAGDSSMMVEVEHLKCRPCSKLGYDQCPKGHFKCMQNIDDQLVIDYVNAL